MNATRPIPPGLRWMRILAIATAALTLASCRPVAAAAPTPDRGDVVPAAGRVVAAGLEAPCPPLPRVGGPDAAFGPPATPFPCGHACPACRGAGAGPDECAPAVCLPGAIPLAIPCLVCDGGDSGRPAVAVGPAGIAHLSAGDTVARYHAADDGPGADCVGIAASNCACVYAPRFAAVREVVHLREDAAPLGPGGLAAEQRPDEEAVRLPTIQRVQAVEPQGARTALAGLAIHERSGALAVEQGDQPRDQQGLVQPAATVAQDRLDLARRTQRPLVAVGFDVPVAWTCVRAANVLLDGRSAEVVAADRGVATLRFEAPGRAELTLCKRAGSDTARQGEELDFTIVMLNSGDRPLAGIVLADALPRRLSYVDGTAAASLPADFVTQPGDDGGMVLTWRLHDTLAPGASGFVRFRTIVR